MQQTWEAPGPGLWRRNDAYMTGAMTRFIESVYIPAMDEGSRDALRTYGVLVERFDFKVLGGRLYRRPRGVGSSDTPRPLPPRAVFSSLFYLHPELRYRGRRAREVLKERRWRAEVKTWREGLRSRFCRINLALQRVEPRGLPDEALRQHVAFATRLLHEGTAQHFRHGPAYTFPVGDWIRQTREWTGLEAPQIFPALKGSSPASAATLAPLDRLARAVEQVPGARALLEQVANPRERLDQLCAMSPGLADAFGEYLTEYGHRLVTGYDLPDLTVRELPNALLNSVAARLRPTSKTGTAVEEEASARIRDRVPAKARDAYDQALEEARIAYGFRDDDVGPTYLWRAGLMRRALLATGERLTERGRVRAPEHLFDASPSEVLELLAGAPGAPSAEELAGRVAERLRLSELELPLELGKPEVAPPLEWLPAKCRRIMEGFLLYISYLDFDTGPRAASTVATLGGHAVGGGAYEGLARVVRSPADFEKIRAGDVLVACTTSPSYNVILPLVGAVVTDRGGMLCHAAIVAREFGIAAVVGTGNATKRIPEGARVLVDGDRGVVELRA
jgi:phosphohistidine swiveling domain-containing protein